MSENVERLSFRALVGESRWGQLAGLGTLRSYPPRALLLCQGEPGDHLLALLNGRVTVVGRDADGEELLVALRGAGDLVGEMAIQRRGVRSASVQSIDRCTVRAISRSVFRDFLSQHRLTTEFADYLVIKLSETVPYQMRLAHFAPRRRLAMLLLEVVALAEPLQQAERMRIPLTQEALARALGLSRSTIAEQLAEFRRVGALAPQRRLVVADPRELARYAGADMA